MSEAKIEITGSLIILVVFLIAIFIWKPIQCNGKTEGMGMESKWSFTGGCQVKTEKGWIPLENYRAL
jgi:low affinity Fe/Cu permease